MPEDARGVSLLLVERFARVFSDFLTALREAIAETAGNPATAGLPVIRVWQTQALPVLEKDEVAIQAAMAAFRQGDPQPILVQAVDKRGLAKDLDGYPLNFAGPEREQQLDAWETAVVVAAYQICSAAGIP